MGTFAVTILGSGGPIANPNRASSGYLLWIDDSPRILVDAGGGAYVRLGEANADVAAIDTVLLTHTHIDHSGGLAPVVFAAYMAGRTTAMTVVGPTGRDVHPGCRRFTELLFGEQGAWSYLHTFNGFGMSPIEAPSVVGETPPAVVLENDGVVVRSVAVPHGMMPALAYRVEYHGKSVVFSGDVQEETPGFIALARNCDLLIHDQAVPEYPVPQSNLHTKPSVTGRIAQRAGCRRLVLTHFMPEVDKDLDSVLATVRSEFDGEVILASDGMKLAAGADA